MAPLFVDNPEHWRQRAAEARAIADQLRDSQSKHDMEEVAKTYDRMAERAEERMKKNRPPQST